MHGLGTLVTIIEAYWWYRISSFIFMKYVDILTALKEGELEETVGNIKKEVL